MFVTFQKFLSVGLFVLAYGYFLHSPGSRTKLFLVLLLASVANVFLSSASGSRGDNVDNTPLCYHSVELFLRQTLLQIIGGCSRFHYRYSL